MKRDLGKIELSSSATSDEPNGRAERERTGQSRAVKNTGQVRGSSLNTHPKEVLCILTSAGFLSEGVMQAFSLEHFKQ